MGGVDQARFDATEVGPKTTNQAQASFCDNYFVCDEIAKVLNKNQET